MTVIEEALKLGACRKAGKIKNFEELAALFLSPQGIEFCMENNYPDIDYFRSVKQEAEAYDIYVDETLELDRSVVLVNSNAKLNFSGCKLYHVVLMHNSKAEIHATNYAVVKIDGKGATTTQDPTAIIL